MSLKLNCAKYKNYKKYFTFTLIILSLLSTGCKQDEEKFYGFIKYNNVTVTSDNDNLAIIKVSLMENEEANLVLGTNFVSRSKISDSSSGITIKRLGGEIKLINSAQAGEPLNWITKSGKIIICTKKIVETNPSTTITYNVILNDG